MDTQKKGTDLQAKGNKPLPISRVWPIAKIKSYIERKRRERQLEKPEERAARITASATKVIAWFTAAMFLTSLLSWWEIHSGGADTHKLAESALSASRPWVIVRATRFGYLKDAKGVDRVSSVVEMSNSGPAPAFEVQGWRCAHVLSEEPTVSSTMPGQYTEDCATENLGMIGKDIPLTLHVNDLSEEILPNTLSNDSQNMRGKHFFAWGYYTYTTPLDNTRHYMSFCMKNAADQLGACRDGNDGD